MFVEVVPVLCTDLHLHLSKPVEILKIKIMIENRSSMTGRYVIGQVGGGWFDEYVGIPTGKVKCNKTICRVKTNCICWGNQNDSSNDKVMMAKCKATFKML